MQRHRAAIRLFFVKPLKTHYAIIANPVSGTRSPSRKRAALEKARRILGAKTYGLDTRTPGELVECARDVAAHCDVLVVAGGDGTFSDIINSIDTVQIPVAFLPLGTGNALSYALQYNGGPATIADRIKHGAIAEYDLLDCEKNKRGFMMSVGLEGAVVRSCNRYFRRGCGGFGTYAVSFADAYFRKYKRATAQITVDDTTFAVKNLLSLMLVKQPYYGFGMKVVPGARFDDGLVHTLTMNSGLFGCTLGTVSAFAGGNRVGRYLAGHQVQIRSASPLPLQIDGDYVCESKTFRFRVLPKRLRIKC